MLYYSLQPRSIPAYLKTHCCMLCGKKMQVRPSGQNQMEDQYRSVFWIKKKDGLRYLLSTHASRKYKENRILQKARDGWGSKSSWPGCLFSYDLTTEDQAGCCICGMISGVLTVTGNIAGTRYPANKNQESIGQPV